MWQHGNVERINPSVGIVLTVETIFIPGSHMVAATAVRADKVDSAPCHSLPMALHRR